jgi:hypothetical protein
VCSLVPGRDGKGGCPDPMHDIRQEEAQRGERAHPEGDPTVTGDALGYICQLARYDANGREVALVDKCEEYLRRSVEEAVDHYVSDDERGHCQGCVFHGGTRKCPGMPLAIEPSDCAGEGVAVPLGPPLEFRAAPGSFESLTDEQEETCVKSPDGCSPSSASSSPSSSSAFTRLPTDSPTAPGPSPRPASDEPVCECAFHPNGTVLVCVGCGLPIPAEPEGLDEAPPRTGAPPVVFKVGDFVRIADVDARGRVADPDKAEYAAVTVKLNGETRPRLFLRADVIPDPEQSASSGPAEPTPEEEAQVVEAMNQVWNAAVEHCAQIADGVDTDERYPPQVRAMGKILARSLRKQARTAHARTVEKKR